MTQIIFEMYAENKSYTQISTFLESKGLRTRNGNIFKRNTLNNILQNDKYIGIYTFNKYHYTYFRKYIGKIPNDDCIRIENAIINFLKNELNDESRISCIKHKMLESWNNTSFKCTKEKNKLKEINQEIKNMLNAIKKGIIFDELETEMSAIQLRKKELEEIF